MGMVQLVKSIVHGMLVYCFHIYRWPISLLNLLDFWIKNIVWSGDIDCWKVCTVTWKSVCLPWDVGGLDLKPTRIINDFLLLHLSWKLLIEETQYSLLFNSHFISAKKPLLCHFKSSIWLGVKNHMVTILDNYVWLIGNGDHINFRLDNWLNTPLVLFSIFRHHLIDNFLLC